MIYYIMLNGGNGCSVDGTLPAGAVECTQEQYLSAAQWTIVNGALVAYSPPVRLPTLAQQAAALQATGLVITSTATPALNATYPADVNTISYINSELNALQQNGTFADGTSAVEWPDTSGALHEFDIAQFKQFAAQIGLFVSGIRKCIIGATGATLPATQANID